MKYLTTRFIKNDIEFLQCTPIKSILRVEFIKEDGKQKLLVFTSDKTMFEATEVLIDTNVTTAQSFVANFYSSANVYVDYKQEQHEISFKPIDKFVYPITMFLFKD